MASTIHLDLRKICTAIINVTAAVDESLDVLGGVVEDGRAKGGEVHEGVAWHLGNSGTVE